MSRAEAEPDVVVPGQRRAVGVLLTSNLFGGVGIASGVTVGALLVEHLGGTSIAGLGQAASVLGAAVAAIPLAAVASRYGRRWSLPTGYALSVVGAVLIITAAVVEHLWVLMAGLVLFGVAQATNLQSRYAAADGVAVHRRARAMSMVIWATTVGSVAGPNLSAAGQSIGEHFGVPGLAGPYLFSVASFAAAGLAVLLFYRRPGAPREDPAAARGAVPEGDEPLADARTLPAPGAVGAWAAIRWALAHPTARFAVALIAGAHAVMVMVMVMTPLHMQHAGMSLQIVGVVIAFHIVGMYALSPVFGSLADRLGPLAVAGIGMATLGAAVTLGFVSAALDAGGFVTSIALTLLGLGWSACTIAGSSIVAVAAPDHVRVPLQGATDAGMNYAGAIAAAASGPILAAADFRGVNVAAAILLAPVVVLLMQARGTGSSGGSGRAGRARARWDAVADDQPYAPEVG